jgi:actin-related protein
MYWRAPHVESGDIACTSQKTAVDCLRPDATVQVLAAGANERRVSAWLGGSILGSLGSFHEIWMSKAEYEEHGARLINKRCP